MQYYSASTGGFYDSPSDAPFDAVEITDAEHAALLAGQSATKCIAPDSTGRPILADRPAPTAEQLAAARIAEIKAELTAIDAASARPLRAVLAATTSGGTADPADVARIAELEAQAVTLRAELAGLEA